jgi:hypothetical protein
MKIRTEDWFAGTYDLYRFRCQKGNLRKLCVSTKERGLNMRNAALLCFLILILCSLRAQDKKSDWKSLYGLRSGEKIELVETGMKKHVGPFSTVTEEAIQLREGSNDIGIRKENVARVTLLEKSHRLRNAAILGVVGAGIGAAASRCSNSTGSFTLCGIARGAEVAVGAVIGLAGGARRHWRRNSQPSHNLSSRASEIEFTPLTQLPCRPGRL